MYKLSATLLLVLCAYVAHSTPDWKLRREENGIKIFTAHSDSSAVKLIRVEFNAEATTHQLIALILDVPMQPEWIYNCKNARILQKLAPNEILFYAEVSLPWPCSNRDYVTHMTITQKSPGHAVIRSYSELNYLPAVPGKVRVKQSATHWEVTTISPTEVKIVYELSFNPGGSIPAWVANMFITKAPINSFEKMREVVTRPEYKNAHQPFLN